MQRTVQQAGRRSVRERVIPVPYSVGGQVRAVLVGRNGGEEGKPVIYVDIYRSVRLVRVPGPAIYDGATGAVMESVVRCRAAPRDGRRAVVKLGGVGLDFHVNRRQGSVRQLSGGRDIETVQAVIAQERTYVRPE